MSTKIVETLNKLDPTNENHWTQDGLPRLDTIKILASDPTLTRDQVTAAAPDFNRASALAAAGGPPAAPATTPAPTAPAAPPAPAVTVQSTESAPPGQGTTDPVIDQAEFPNMNEAPLAEAATDSETLKVLLDEAMLNLNEAMAEQHEAAIKVQNAQNEVGRLEDTLASLAKTTENPIMQYLAQQQVNLEARGAKIQLIKESGLDLKGLARSLKAPIDTAMERKTGHGKARPAR